MSENSRRRYRESGWASKATARKFRPAGASMLECGDPCAKCGCAPCRCKDGEEEKFMEGVAKSFAGGRKSLKEGTFVFGLGEAKYVPTNDNQDGDELKEELLGTFKKIGLTEAERRRMAATRRRRIQENNARRSR